MQKPHIYLVDDNVDLQATISENLMEEGYQVTQFYSAADLLRALENCPKENYPDTILLDLILPDGNGLSLIEKIHLHTNAPIIVISGKGQLVDKIVGLEVGADDYISKPFEIRELLARIKAHVRRHTSHKQQNDTNTDDGAPRRFGQWTLNPLQMQIFDEKGNSAELTVKEYRLLEALVTSPDRVLSREQLLNKSRDNEAEVFDRTIDIQITRIRKKIGEEGNDRGVIKTVRGVGYMFVSDKNRQKN